MEIREKIVKELLHKIDVNMDTLAMEDSVNVFSEFIRALTLESEMLGTHKGRIASEIAASASMSVSASTGINTTKPQDPITNLIIFNDDIYSWDSHGRVRRLSNNNWETVAIFDEGIEKVATIFGYLCVSTIKTEERPSKIYKSSGGTTWELQQADAEVDESTKQQTEAADAYMRDLSVLFQLSGDHQKEVDEILARSASRAAKIAKAALSAVNESDMHRNANRETQLLDIIKAARKYVKQANLAAEAKHDTPGIYSVDSTLYLIMEESKELLSRMDSVVNESTKTLKDAGII